MSVVSAALGLALALTSFVLLSVVVHDALAFAGAGIVFLVVLHRGHAPGGSR